MTPPIQAISLNGEVCAISDASHPQGGPADQDEVIRPDPIGPTDAQLFVQEAIGGREIPWPALLRGGYVITVIRLENEERITMQPPPSPEPAWPKIIGVVLIFTVVLFIMVIVSLDLAGVQLHRAGQGIFAVLVGIVLAGALGFIGGTVDVSGSVPIPKLEIKPIHFSATGGIAGFVLGLLLVVATFKLLGSDTGSTAPQPKSGPETQRG